MERQLNFVNNLNNRVRKRYYIDDNSEFDLVPQEENNQVYSINDNQLFQMEVANEEEEISGNIVSFMGRQKTKIEKLQANIQPVQNLNGYDAPWPAGGGKNLLPQQEITGGMSNVQVSSNGDKVTINGTASAYGQAVSDNTITLDAGTYFLKIFVVSGSFTSGYVQYQLRSVNGAITYASTVNGLEFTLQERTELKPRVVYTNGTVISNYIIRTMVVSGSTAPTAYAPYENLCPITGWDSVTVNRTGKNLCYKVLPYRSTLIGDGNKYSKILNAPGTSACFKCVEGETYIVSGATGRNRGLVAYFDSDPELDSQSVYPNTTAVTAFADGFSFTAEHTAYALCYLANTTLSDVNIQIELGSTATAYEPYNGNTYTIALGQTVYGGTLDVVNGKMTVDRVGFVSTSDNLNGLEESTSTSTNDWLVVRKSNAFPNTDGNKRANSICSHTQYKFANVDGTAHYYITTNGFWMVVPKSAYPTFTDFASTLTGNDILTCVAYIATPQTVQLTPTEVSTLAGENYVWSDAGPITLKYSTKGLTTYLLKP